MLNKKFLFNSSDKLVVGRLEFILFFIEIIKFFSLLVNFLPLISLMFIALKKSSKSNLLLVCKGKLLKIGQITFFKSSKFCMIKTP